MIGAGLAGVYTFLYVTLRRQDYALLIGSVALFLILAVVMYVTRRVDWYARDVGLVVSVYRQPDGSGWTGC
jgi:inner membrane protein involved in colicin E2 resistance